MSEIDVYRIQQIVDNSNAVQISLIEDVQTEPLSQKQLIIENVSKKLDDDTKKQVMPLLDANSVPDTAFGIIIGCIYSSFLQTYTNQSSTPNSQDIEEFTKIIIDNSKKIKESIIIEDNPKLKQE